MLESASALDPEQITSPSYLDGECEDSLVTRHKPGLEKFLRAVGLDVVYHRAQGDLLYFRRGDEGEVEVLDLVGGYGALALGHRHPQIVKAITDFLASGLPNHAQGSIRPGALHLAEALNARSQGDYCTILANSGTEAVEAALKHALLETQGRTFIALHGGFHGKTLGSLYATSNPRFRQPFCQIPGNVVRVTPDDITQLQGTFQRVEDPAGFIVEPIQGEAGVRPLSVEFLQAAKEMCAARNIPLIADESQTGLGRTGSFLATEALGVTPDYVILSKALGGGLAKISALLIDRSRYRSDFDLIHSSTFADDELSCQVALKVLSLIDDDTMAACRRQGDYLFRQLRRLQERYPSVIADVRGRGLMIGVEMHRPEPQAGVVLNHLADRELLGPLVCGYLLHQHRVRVAPTLSDPSTIRLQPSLLIDRDRSQQFVAALEDVCQRLATNDVLGLSRFLARRISEAEPLPMDCGGGTSSIYYFHPHRATSTNANPDSKSSVHRVAWIFHLVDSSDLAHMDPALSALTEEEKLAFCERWNSVCEPLVMDEVDIRSSTGEAVRLVPILLPVTSQQMRSRSRGKHRAHSRRLVQRAVDVAAALRCNVVTLAQFTSIVTRRGASLQSHGMQITTGNNYTAALIRQAVHAELKRRSRDPRKLTLAVVGAAGDIGRTCVAMMAPDFRQSILVGSGRTGSMGRLDKVAHGIHGARVGSTLQSVQEANVVICATSSTVAPLGPGCLRPDAIVCDASVPASLQPRKGDDVLGVTVLPGGIAVLPGKESLKIPGFPLPRGFTYGCMAEGLLLGLEREMNSQIGGRSSPGRAWELSHVASRHGFAAAEGTLGIDLLESST